MTLTEHALRGSVVTAGPPNRMAVGLPWFRSTPLSAVVDARLRIAGREVDGIAVEVDGAAVPVADLRALVDRYWFVQERLVLTWDGSVPSDRAVVDAALVLRLHLPFLAGPGGGSVQVEQDVRGVVPIERAA